MFETLSTTFGTAWAYYFAFAILGVWWLIAKVTK